MRRPVAAWLVASSVAVTLALSSLSLRSGRSQEADPPKDTPAAAEEAETETEPTIDPLSVNATCYVCHTTFVWEELSKQHLPEDVTCIECHGVSAGHANDENVGATKPDIMYGREQIDAMCRECHTEHDVPARDVIARALQRKLTVTEAALRIAIRHAARIASSARIARAVTRGRIAADTTLRGVKRRDS